VKSSIKKPEKIRKEGIRKNQTSGKIDKTN
jgi:hypothetical protein